MNGKDIILSFKIKKTIQSNMSVKMLRHPGQVGGEGTHL